MEYFRKQNIWNIHIYRFLSFNWNNILSTLSYSYKSVLVQRIKNHLRSVAANMQTQSLKTEVHFILLYNVYLTVRHSNTYLGYVFRIWKLMPDTLNNNISKLVQLPLSYLDYFWKKMCFFSSSLSLKKWIIKQCYTK